MVKDNIRKIMYVYLYTYTYMYVCMYVWLGHFAE